MFEDNEGAEQKMNDMLLLGCVVPLGIAVLGGGVLAYRLTDVTGLMVYAIILTIIGGALYVSASGAGID